MLGCIKQWQFESGLPIKIVQFGKKYAGRDQAN